MENGVGSAASRARHLLYLLALVVAAVLGLAVAVPVFAVEEPAAEETTAQEPVVEETTAEEGGTVQPQVVGGEPVENGRFPFMVSIQADTSNAQPYREHFCGGSLIDRDSVLTAAHCADVIGRFNTPRTVAFRDVRIVVGLTELNSQQGEARRIASFSDVSIHPRFNRANFANDAAVIDLASPVSKAPITLASPSSGNALERPGRRAAVAGWGNTIQQSPNFSEPDSSPNRLRVAYPPIVSDREAAATYNSSNDASLRFVPKVMVAAGKEGVDTCQGDSGGPMWRVTDAGRRQIGITSKGAGCGARGFPGVYAEVNNTSITNFIRGAASN